MPVPYLRRLTGSNRNRTANRQLAHFLASIAGAAKAGGYVAVKQYTSQMPLAAVLFLLAVVPVVDDLRERGIGTCNAVGSGSYR